MYALLLVLRIARYFVVLGTFLGALALLTEVEGYLMFRIFGAIGLSVAGVVVALALALWSGHLAYEYAPDDPGLRRTLITGKMGPPQSPQDRSHKDGACR
jgi:hypothetical protein